MMGGLVEATIVTAGPAPGADRRKQRQGLYRIRYPAPLGNDVRTREVGGGEELTIAEALYCARRYGPPVELLPWEDEYFSGARD